MGLNHIPIQPKNSTKDRAIAERVLARLDLQTSFSMTQMSTMANWLMASVFALNGAGALTVANAAVNNQNVWTAGGFFIAGLVFSLLNGVGLQEFYNSVPVVLLEHENYWSDVSRTGERSAIREKELSIVSSKALKFRWVPPVLGWIGGLMFIAGCIILGYHFADRDHSSERRCEALEKDILSSHPKRSDSLEIFVAFGCKVSTNTSVMAR